MRITIRHSFSLTNIYLLLSLTFSKISLSFCLRYVFAIPLVEYPYRNLWLSSNGQYDENNVTLSLCPIPICYCRWRFQKSLSLSLSFRNNHRIVYIYMVFGCQNMSVVKSNKKRGVDWAFLVFGVKRWSGHESREKLWLLSSNVTIWWE